MPPKDETSGRLLSKVAKFVRNPLKDWSELDAQDSVPAENGYSREMLKEMIERRQRNDFVRRREFDMLRKLRRREAAGGTDGTAAVSSFNLSTSGKSEGRALTLKKIDEIEEQMSQQWWKGRHAESAAPAGEPENPTADDAERRARAYADTVPGVPPPRPAAASDAAPPEPRPVPSALEDAAIRFAEGDDEGAETALLQSVAPDGPQAENIENWRALLDFYRATGDAEKFGAASTRYAQRLKRQGPEWVSLRVLARDAQSAQAAMGAAAASSRGAAWVSPPRLAREDLSGLTQALAAAGPEWQIDWRPLQAIAPEAVPPLRALFTHWADSPVQLRFAGAEQLLAVLAQATPMGERSVDVAWWQLRMAVLRAVHEADMFELAALNYCITYEVTPPPWADPRGSYAMIGPDQRAPDLQGDASGLPAASRQAALAGELTGHCTDVLARIDRELAHTSPLLVSCTALVRVDLEAARALLDWTAGYQDHGLRIEFVDVQRMVAAFFHVVGITDHAGVAVRSR